MNLDILFRTCSRVNTFTGPPRFINVPKSEIILRCLKSVLIACSKAEKSPITLYILDDHSDADTVNQIHKLLKSYPQINSNFISISATGNGESLKANYQFARDNCKDLVYFCEDDYLHSPDAIKAMLDSYNLNQANIKGGKIILHPCDYPDRYLNPYPSYIFLGSDRHWRSIMHTTGTFLLPVSILLEYWENYMKFSEYGITPGVSENNSINLVYKEILCVSPLPSLAIHLQYKSTLSHFTDWQKWWEDSST